MGCLRGLGELANVGVGIGEDPHRVDECHQLDLLPRRIRGSKSP